MMKRSMAIIIAASLFIALLSGCAGNESSVSEAEPSSSLSSPLPSEESSAPAESAAPVESPPPMDEVTEAPPEDTPAKEEATDTAPAVINGISDLPSISAEEYYSKYFPNPESTGVKLTYYLSVQPAATLNLILPYGFEDSSEFYKYLMELSGVEIEFITGSRDTATTDLQLMVVSGEYYDLIAQDFYSSGTEMAVEDGVYMDLKPYLAEYAPYYWALLNSKPEYLATATTDKGYMAGVHGFTMTESGPYATFGPVIRQDWLDKLNMDIPETYDDYYNVLKAFQTELGADSAFLMPSGGSPNNNYLAAGYEVASVGLAMPNSAPWYQVDGKVMFGFLEDNYLDYLSMLVDWYAEGLIYKDYYSSAQNVFAPNNDVVGADDAGFFYCNASDMATLEELSDGMKLTPVPDVVKETGQVLHLYGGQESTIGGAVIITTHAADIIEPILRWLDYMFTYDGYMLWNYGVEGMTYNLNEKNEIVFTELMTNNSDGLSIREAMYRYTGMYYTGIGDESRFWTAYTDAQITAGSVWVENSDGAWAMPTGMSLSADQQTEYSLLYADIFTYLSENLTKIVVDEYDISYMDTIKDTLYNTLHIQECIDIYQAALDSYYKKL